MKKKKKQWKKYLLQILLMFFVVGNLSAQSYYKMWAKQERKDATFTKREIKKIGNRLYGCDTCQTVCPKNKGKANWIHEELMPDPEIAKPLLKPLLTISNKEFKAKFGHISGAWRGKKPIQRNAILALAHFKEEDALPDLIELLNKDERPVIRGTAAWAIGKINALGATETLQKALETEQDPEVLLEIQKGLALATY